MSWMQRKTYFLTRKDYWPMNLMPVLACCNNSKISSNVGLLDAEDDPFSDELDVEEQVARLLRSGSKHDGLEDLDR